MAPLSTVKVTKEKLNIALSWFDELGSSLGMEECDRVLDSQVLEPLAGDHTQDTADAVVEGLETAVRYYDLIHSQECCFELVHQLLEKSPTSFSEESLRKLVLLIKGHEICRTSLMVVLKTFLPESMTSEQQELLIQNGILHHYLKSQILLKRVVEIVNETNM
ncbi:expressed unknown protein [Seminavis robusta]|uniref:Uncharacterized protein n=1 Tax=Seminavis robusta TaxID=568900 RepID=A0A9N8DES0_9STRA|nr:expressed unknown protein [Seminavis robusta]|eukprot:Sro106_g236591.1  (163) ;mRNA; r:4211-4699